MKYLSVCSGIEAATVAWHHLGWEPVSFAEIEPFASAVLAHHWPAVPNLGDFTKIGTDDVGAIELLVGGTPCQDFSVAGLRAGLAGDRGALTIEFLHLARRLRPEWLVWENVPGVLSADGGRAFGAFLGLLEKLGYGFAYRVLDAQYFGVPQRRRRVFVVGCFGDWKRAAAVLFERESLSRHPAPSRKAGPGSSLIAGDGLGGGGADDNLAQGNHLIAHTLKAEGFDASEDGTGRGVPIVTAFALRGRDEGARPEIHADGDTVGSLRAASGGSTRDLIAFSCKDHAQDAGDTSPTLRSMNEVDGHANGGGQVAAFTDVAQPIRTNIYNNSDPGMEATMNVLHGSAVRRLTPRECERLQGFPDDYTLVPYRKKPAADGPRYRALGNSFAVPVVAWIGERIAMVESEAEK